MIRSLVLTVLMLLGAGCGLLTEPDGPVRVSAEAGHIVVRNGSDRPIYFLALEQETAALVDWIPCTNPDTCESVAAGGEREVPLTSIPGYSSAADVILVYWWHLEARAEGGFRPDAIRVERVRL